MSAKSDLTKSKSGRLRILTSRTDIEQRDRTHMMIFGPKTAENMCVLLICLVQSKKTKRTKNGHFDQGTEIKKAAQFSMSRIKGQLVLRSNKIVQARSDANNCIQGPYTLKTGRHFEKKEPFVKNTTNNEPEMEENV